MYQVFQRKTVFPCGMIQVGWLAKSIKNDAEAVIEFGKLVHMMKWETENVEYILVHTRDSYKTLAAIQKTNQGVSKWES